METVESIAVCSTEHTVHAKAWNYKDYVDHHRLVLSVQRSSWCIWELDEPEFHANVCKLADYLCCTAISGRLHLKQLSQVAIFEWETSPGQILYPFIELWDSPAPGTTGVQLASKRQIWVGTDGLESLVAQGLGFPGLSYETLLTQLLLWLEFLKQKQKKLIEVC